ncbi:hypothetical protein Mapa_008229 [Marchantia paleacea]|nr:hypothetical protein Mapa_008229 [Marchantia paleacea]
MGSEEEERDGSSIVYKMKVVNTLGRSVPIILQNDNGPCPLLAVSNVLLLRNNVTLNLDMSEISQRELMSLVAEWLLDANSNVQNKDDEYVKNQQQNIEDAIQLLPRLATGIDVNVRFRHIHDFEFTRECAIFDLFHVGLVHGWLCDPQDEVTSTIIGANSYNTLVEKLVALHALKAEKEASAKALAEEEPTVDFAAATTATLGVPTPILLKNLSNVSNVSTDSFEHLRHDSEKPRRKGDDEEAAELLQALQLSQAGMETEIPVAGSSSGVGNDSVTVTSPKLVVSLPVPQKQSTLDDGTSQLPTTKTDLSSEDGADSGSVVREVVEEVGAGKTSSSDIKTTAVDNEPVTVQSSVQPEEREVTREDVAKPVCRELSLAQLPLQPIGGERSVEEIAKPKPLEIIESSNSVGDVNLSSPVYVENYARSPSCESNVSIFTVGEDVKTAVDPLDLDLDLDPMDYQQQGRLSTEGLGSSSENFSPRNYKPPSESSSSHLPDESEECASSGIDDEEPLYEGELSLTGSAVTNIGEKDRLPEEVAIIADKEPMYEGESVLAEQVLGGDGSSAGERHNSEKLKEEELTRDAMKEGLTIEKFLSDTASQLTYHGLFSLQEGLKDNELYVFFRNNHFSTIFKNEGHIYLLATDQGYLNQPDLVWEKLSEVDGNSTFYTGNFQQFEVDQTSGSWNEQDAVAATADYMSSHHGTAGGAEGASYYSDLQLAMALQQQELAQQQQQQQQQLRSPSPAAPRVSQPSSKSPSLAATRLVTGPPRSVVPPPKPEKATKEKCTIM